MAGANVCVCVCVRWQRWTSNRPERCDRQLSAPARSQTFDLVQTEMGACDVQNSAPGDAVPERRGGGKWTLPYEKVHSRDGKSKRNFPTCLDQATVKKSRSPSPLVSLFFHFSLSSLPFVV